MYFLFIFFVFPFQLSAQVPTLKTVFFDGYKFFPDRQNVTNIRIFYFLDILDIRTVKTLTLFSSFVDLSLFVCSDPGGAFELFS